MLKNLTMYKLQKPWSMPPGELEEKLSKYPLLAPNASQVQTYGWVPVGPDKQVVYSADRQMLIALGWQKKNIPGSAIKAGVEEATKALEKQQGFAPGKAQIRTIKEVVVADLMARAIPSIGAIQIWIDPENDWIVVDTSSVKKAEDALTVLRAVLGTLEVVPPQTKDLPQIYMSRWLSSGHVPGGLAIGDTSSMQSSDGKKATVKFARHEIIGCPEVTKHIDLGKVVSQIGLGWNDSAYFTFTDKFQLKSFKIAPPDEADEKDSDKSLAFEADFRLAVYAMQGSLKALCDGLEVE